MQGFVQYYITVNFKISCVFRLSSWRFKHWSKQVCIRRVRQFIGWPYWLTILNIPASISINSTSHFLSSYSEYVQQEPHFEIPTAQVSIHTATRCSRTTDNTFPQVFVFFFFESLTDGLTKRAGATVCTWAELQMMQCWWEWLLGFVLGFHAKGLQPLALWQQVIELLHERQRLVDAHLDASQDHGHLVDLLDLLCVLGVPLLSLLHDAEERLHREVHLSHPQRDTPITDVTVISCGRYLQPITRH